MFCNVAFLSITIVLAAKFASTAFADMPQAPVVPEPLVPLVLELPAKGPNMTLLSAILDHSKIKRAALNGKDITLVGFEDRTCTGPERAKLLQLSPEQSKDFILDHVFVGQLTIGNVEGKLFAAYHPNLNAAPISPLTSPSVFSIPTLSGKAIRISVTNDHVFLSGSPLKENTNYGGRDGDLLVIGGCGNL